MVLKKPPKPNLLLASSPIRAWCLCLAAAARSPPTSLIARYVASGWLLSPARGVYMRKGGRLQWEGVVRSV